MCCGEGAKRISRPLLCFTARSLRFGPSLTLSPCLLAGELLDPSKPKEAYGYGSILWAENAHQPLDADMNLGDGSSGGSSPPKSEGSAGIKPDNSRMPLSRKVPITSMMLNPYR